jgi:hypothetical protein
MSAENIIALTISAMSFLVSLGSFGLGLFNAYHNTDRDRVKLKVIPLFARMHNEGMLTSASEILEPGFIVIKVINRSTFAVNIKDIGFNHRGGMRAALITPYRIYEDLSAKLPYVLEARQEMTIHGPAEILPDYVDAYAITVCGTKVNGTSKAFRKFRRLIR